MQHWYLSSGRSLAVDTILFEQEMLPFSESICGCIEKFGMNFLIGIYCTPGENFNSKHFKSTLMEFEMSALTALKYLISFIYGNNAADVM